MKNLERRNNDTPPRYERLGVAASAIALAVAGLTSACGPKELECNIVGEHVVDFGDTAWDLARELNDDDVSINDTLAEVRAVNPDVSLGQLQIGDKLNIPGDCNN